MKFIYFILAMVCVLPLIDTIQDFIKFLSSESFSGFSGFYTFVFYIVIIIFLLFLLVLILGAFAGQMLKEKSQKTLPVITDNAKVISKNTKITGRHAHTHFYVAFELESGDRKQFEVTNEQYSFLLEEETGVLYYKEGNGSTFFEKFEVKE